MSRKTLLDIDSLIKQLIEINCSCWRWRCKYILIIAQHPRDI